MVICLLALFIGLIGIVLPEQEEIAFEFVVNNTELCQYNHTLGYCTGSRNTTTLYWANDSAIQIFLISHANTVGANASIQLYINGTQVSHTSGRPLGTAEDNYKQIVAIIPKGSNYSATFLNFHHYEWREYPILSGKNGTLSINQTIVGGTGSQNLSQVLNQGNTAQNQYINYTNTGKWLKIGYNSVFNLMEINTSSIMYFTQNGQFLGFTGNGFAYSSYDNKPMKFGQSGSNASQIAYNSTQGTTWWGIGNSANRLNITGFDKLNLYQELDLNNNALTNCSNCGGNQNLSQVLTQGNDANNQGISNLNNISGASYQLTLINTSFVMDRTINWSDSNLVSTGQMVTRNNGNITSVFRDMGAQFWYLHYSSASAGYNAGDFGGMIGYSTPGNGIGFSLRNSTPGINQTVWQSQWRHDLYFGIDSGSNDYFLCVAPGNQTTIPTCKLKIYANGTILHPNLVGSGNAYICVDATGKEFRGNPGC